MKNHVLYRNSIELGNYLDCFFVDEILDKNKLRIIEFVINKRNDKVYYSYKMCSMMSITK